MSVQRMELADGTVTWRVRWRDGGRGQPNELALVRAQGGRGGVR